LACLLDAGVSTIAQAQEGCRTEQDKPCGD